MGTALIPHEAPALLSLREVRLAGQTANRLSTLRGALATGLKGGSLTIQTRNGTSSLALTSIDMEALISLLTERDELFLTSLNIEIKE